MSVDLPAPLGPMRAWIPPGRTVRSTPSVACSAPKAWRRPCSSSSASVMARLPRQQADDAAAREQHHRQQDEPEHELPAVGPAAEEALQQDEERGAGERPEEAPDAAEDDEDEEPAPEQAGPHTRAYESAQSSKERERGGWGKIVAEGERR